MKLFLILCFLCFFFSSAFSIGFRKGWYLSTGFGGGYASATGDVESSEPSYEFSYSNYSLDTHFFEFGYAPTQKLMIGWAFGSTMALINTPDESKSMGLLFPLVAHYYLKPDSPTMLLNAGIGIPVFANFAMLSTETSIESTSGGIGLMGGVGYEFKRFWSINGEVLYGHISGANDLDTAHINNSFYNLSLKIKFTLY